MTGNILIIDDEEQLRKLLGRIIGLEGFNVEEAGTIKQGTELLKRKDIDVVLCDVKLPDGNGVEFIKDLKKLKPVAEIILLTAYGNIPDGVQAIKNGAFDYITKGNENDRIIPLLHQAAEKVNIKKRSAVKINEGTEISFSSIIGKSPIIQETIILAKKIAVTDASVLLLGETGTGKEIFAKSIHRESKRKLNPFVAINCSTFSKELLEGELFGHKAGAYTGAIKDKAGLIELADNGTLFLDEIGEMGMDIQAKLLRVLENGEFIKLGDIKTSKVDVRIIAATNVDLKQYVENGRFREDLYYRLNTFMIALPSLRERTEDIKEIAVYFIEKFGRREGKMLKLSDEAVNALNTHYWKGNIRELRNVIERAVILADEEFIRLSDLPSEIQMHDTINNNYSLAEVEKMHIRKMFNYTQKNKTRTAQLLGIGVATLYRKLDEYGLK
jgi:DNA-binding NtrC family response regulator